MPDPLFKPANRVLATETLPQVMLLTTCLTTV
jgi:hypothetical protein